jgi:chemotaxis methyl-accepting protein methylase
MTLPGPVGGRPPGMPGMPGGLPSEPLPYPANPGSEHLRPDTPLGRAAAQGWAAARQVPGGAGDHYFAPCAGEPGVRVVLPQASSGSAAPITPPPEPGCPLDQAKRWVANTYGPGAVRQFDRIHRSTGQDVDAALSLFMQEPTPTQSWMGRDFYQIDTALDALPPALPRSGGRIAVIGCSKGEEAFAFAAAALWRGLEDVHVLGIDVNREMLRQAEDPYTRYKVLRQIPALEACFAFEDVQGGRAGPPLPALRRCVGFSDLDVLQRPLASIAARSDMVALRHVLKHYPEAARRAILANVVSGLVPGGMLVLEDTSDNVTGPTDAPRLVEGPTGLLKPEYAMWRHRLAQPEAAAAYGLQAMDIGLPDKPAAYFRRLA